MTGIPEDIFNHVEFIRDTARELVSRSWAESFFGNISILIEDQRFDIEVVKRFPSPVKAGVLEGKMILATRTTSTMNDVIEDPEGSLGLFRMKGKNLELLWGEGPPTSEISSHLLAYTTGRGRCILHCHMDCIGKPHDDHSDLPEGCCMIEDRDPGSLALAEATRDAFQRCDTVIWKGHGAISIAIDLDTCLERMIRLERHLSHPVE